MGQITPNYALTKPEEVDNYTEEVMSDNMAIIDEALAGHDESIQALETDLSATSAAAIRSYYQLFEEEDWGDDGTLHIASTVHGLATGAFMVSSTVHMRIGRSALDYTADNYTDGRAGIVSVVTAALSDSTITKNDDGVPILTWAQVQGFLLADTLWATATAETQATALGFDWSGRDTTGVEETVTLEELLAAAYTPALGGSSTAFNNLCTLEVLQGLRFRCTATVTGNGGVGYANTYDLDGWMTPNTWGAMESQVYIDTSSGDLVLRSGSAFAGEIMVMARP